MHFLGFICALDCRQHVSETMRKESRSKNAKEEGNTKVMNPRCQKPTVAHASSLCDFKQKNLAQRAQSPQRAEPNERNLIKTFEPRIDTDKNQDCWGKPVQTSLPLFARIPSVGIRVIRGKISSAFFFPFASSAPFARNLFCTSGPGTMPAPAGRMPTLPENLTTPNP